MKDITVRKLDLQGNETWRYSGRLLERAPQYLRLEAHFNRPDMPFHGILLARGDRFVEEFYSDRWYNIFEIHDRDDDRLKGWYCNICFPAEFDHETVSYVDLALDLLVYPDGKQLILDIDEFNNLALSPEDRARSLDALQALQDDFTLKFDGRL